MRFFHVGRRDPFGVKSHGALGIKGMFHKSCVHTLIRMRISVCIGDIAAFTHRIIIRNIRYIKGISIVACFCEIDYFPPAKGVFGGVAGESLSSCSVGIIVKFRFKNTVAVNRQGRLIMSDKCRTVIARDNGVIFFWRIIILCI